MNFIITIGMTTSSFNLTSSARSSARSSLDQEQEHSGLSISSMSKVTTNSSRSCLEPTMAPYITQLLNIHHKDYERANNPLKLWKSSHAFSKFQTLKPFWTLRWPISTSIRTLCWRSLKAASISSRVKMFSRTCFSSTKARLH